MDQEEAEEVSFVPSAISVPQKHLFRCDNQCSEKTIRFWQFASVVIKEGEESHTTNLCQQCYNESLKAKGDEPLTKWQWHVEKRHRGRLWTNGKRTIRTRNVGTFLPRKSKSWKVSRGGRRERFCLSRSWRLSFSYVLLLRSRRLSFSCVLLLRSRRLSFSCAGVGVVGDGFQTQRRGVKNVQKKSWRVRSRLMGERSGRVNSVRSKNVWTRWRCRRCYHDIPAVLRGKYRQAVAARNGELSMASSTSDQRGV